MTMQRIPDLEQVVNKNCVLENITSLLTAFYYKISDIQKTVKSSRPSLHFGMIQGGCELF